VGLAVVHVLGDDHPVKLETTQRLVILGGRVRLLGDEQELDYERML